jgi:hypothetical protein
VRVRRRGQEEAAGAAALRRRRVAVGTARELRRSRHGTSLPRPRCFVTGSHFTAQEKRIKKKSVCRDADRRSVSLIVAVSLSRSCTRRAWSSRSTSRCCSSSSCWSTPCCAWASSCTDGHRAAAARSPSGAPEQRPAAVQGPTGD